MFNDAIVGEEFFGRTEVLSLLDKRVSALKEGYRQNIAITGQRLSGKTCLLYHFLDKLKDPYILPIYVEVTGEPFPVFADRFIGTLLYTFLKIKDEPVQEDFGYILEKAKAHMPQTVRTIIEVKSLLDNKDFDSAYTALLNITSIIKKETQVRCIVIFDEFQNLSLLGIKDPFSHFGKVIMIQKDTMYIISSSDKSTIQKILTEKLSLLFGNFEVIELKGFDFKSSKKFLDRKLVNFNTSDGIKSFLITFTDGNPFYMDLLCVKLQELTLASSANVINPKAVVDAIENLYFNSKGTVNQYFTNLINSLCLNTATLNVLVAITKGARTVKDIKESAKISFAETSIRLKRLMELNVIFKNGVFYSFIDKGFLFWINEVYSRKQTSLVSSSVTRAEKFKNDIHKHLSKFLFDLKKDCSQRISDLFTKFNGEIVEIGEKRHCLPKFKKIDLISLNKTSSLLLAHKDKKLWLCFIKEGPTEENDIILFMKWINRLKPKVINKILIPLDGTDINATLLAKQNKIWIWNLKGLNLIMEIYTQGKIIRYT